MFGDGRLPRVIHEIVEVARRRGCCALTGASQSGQRLIGALMFAMPGEFHIWSTGTSESVLAVDGVALSDTGVTLTMQFAVNCGATATYGVFVTPTEFGAEVTSIGIEIVGGLLVDLAAHEL